jgi:spore maturation protein CgeB
VTQRPAIYVGWGERGGTSRQRMEALRDAGYDVTFVDMNDPPASWIGVRAARSLIRRTFGRVDRSGANRHILHLARERRPQVLWLDKGLIVEPDTLREVRQIAPDCAIVGYSPDDMANPTNRSRQFFACLPLYDAFFTTKSYQVAELRAAGCPSVHFIANAFDPRVHRPMDLTREQREALGGPVGFIGRYEPERAASMDRLAAAGIDVRVWGTHWKRFRPTSRRLKLERRVQVGDDYARTICAFDINLAYLSKENRDLQTTRTMEIPACGAFMLAERTDEHRELFAEGREAEFFSSDAELQDKVRYYLAEEPARRRIAAAGRQRCLRSGYSNPERMATMLTIVGSLKRRTEHA